MGCITPEGPDRVIRWEVGQEERVYKQTGAVPDPMSTGFCCPCFDREWDLYPQDSGRFAKNSYTA